MRFQSAVPVSCLTEKFRQWETAKAVEATVPHPITQLKLGVNEIVFSRDVVKKHGDMKPTRFWQESISGAI